MSARAKKTAQQIVGLGGAFAYVNLPGQYGYQGAAFLQYAITDVPGILYPGGSAPPAPPPSTMLTRDQLCARLADMSVYGSGKKIIVWRRQIGGGWLAGLPITVAAARSQHGCPVRS